MVIRKIEKHEKETIDEIIANEIEIFGENGAVDIWNLKPLIKYGKVYGLFSKENLISWIQLISDWEKEKIYIYGIATKKEFVGKGYAKKLVKEVINNCLDDDFKSLELTVSPNNINAIKFYEKIGFLKKEYLENEYGHGNHRWLYEMIL